MAAFPLQNPPAPPQPAVPSLDLAGLCFCDQIFLNFVGGCLVPGNVFDYFANSPFYDRTCKNEQPRMQGIHPLDTARLMSFHVFQLTCVSVVESSFRFCLSPAILIAQHFETSHSHTTTRFLPSPLVQGDGGVGVFAVHGARASSVRDAEAKKGRSRSHHARGRILNPGWVHLPCMSSSVLGL
ncbi:unnamed protein product [Closterium sp. Yama58-4]|nr:unnamed protein product [Closterium sp. Yama58-4]